jgi:Flp pilus assembly pilin Flp
MFGEACSNGGVMKTTSRILANETGVTAIEYALLAALIVVSISGGVSALGGDVQAMYQHVCTEVVRVISGGAC